MHGATLLSIPQVRDWNRRQYISLKETGDHPIGPIRELRIGRVWRKYIAVKDCQKVGGGRCVRCGSWKFHLRDLQKFISTW